MKTHTFTGATSREVLNKVKLALGDDALILSNRARDGEIEVVALAAEEMTPAARLPLPFNDEDDDEGGVVTSFSPAVQRREVPAFTPAPQLEPQRLDAPRGASVSHAIPAVQQHFRALESAAGAVASAAAPTAAHIAAPTAARAAAPSAPATPIDGILSEIQSLKTILRNEIAAFGSLETAKENAAATAPRAQSAHTTVIRDLLNAGFSVQISRRLAGAAQAAGAVASTDALADCLASELKVADPDELINAGGVYAFVGPTGVGKTTTVAKLAARAVVRFGASKVALLTTDGYRIGAYDQLRIYGRILSVPVHAIRDANELSNVLAGLSSRHLVLIDTIGMSQRDRMVAEHAAMLSTSGQVKRLLLVSTTANAATLNQVVSVYKSSGVHGCILTKTDEAASLAPALDAIIRHDLPLHYVTDGQRVPEDLQLPDAAALAREALNPSAPSLDLEAEDVLAQPLPPAAVAAPMEEVVEPEAVPGPLSPAALAALSRSAPRFDAPLLEPRAPVHVAAAEPAPAFAPVQLVHSAQSFRVVHG